MNWEKNKRITEKDEEIFTNLTKKGSKIIKKINEICEKIEKDDGFYNFLIEHEVNPEDLNFLAKIYRVDSKHFSFLTNYSVDLKDFKNIPQAVLGLTLGNLENKDFEDVLGELKVLKDLYDCKKDIKITEDDIRQHFEKQKNKKWKK